MNSLNSTNSTGFIDPAFYRLPPETQEAELKLFEHVNKVHLHCEDKQTWEQVHQYLTFVSVQHYEKKAQRLKNRAANITPQIADQTPIGPKNDFLKTRLAVGRLLPNEFYKFSIQLKQQLNTVFFDRKFVEAISAAYICHILHPLQKNAELCHQLTQWLCYNAMFLPLGAHLLEAFKEDMSGESAFAKSILCTHKFKFLPEASSHECIHQMKAFLTEAGQAHWHSSGKLAPRPEKPTAVIISVKNGAGGHASPHNAMGARLRELGWDVHFMYYDTDLPQHNDSFKKLGITFEDGMEMTGNLFQSRWRLQKQNKEASRVVSWYVTFFHKLYPDLFYDDKGADLLNRKILPINPHLIITTCAYHWSWQSLAYRVPTAKTLLVASDVFFHSRASHVWQRQRSKSFPKECRNVHFTAMTEDCELLTCESHFHDEFYKQKYPGKPFESWKTLELGFHIDEQITVIGAPVNPAFKVPGLDEIPRLRNKWNIPEGSISICLSRGKIGADFDLKPALESYRSDAPFAKDVILNVVCGENEWLFQQLEKKTLALPNITIIPHRLLPPSDFAELRAISLVDDIKAGGGSTFEGWYMISQGIQSMLFLTPGTKLWWENANCLAMEKWGIGKTFNENSNKTTILNEIIQGKLPPITNLFKDWRPPFDQLTSSLKTEVLK